MKQKITIPNEALGKKVSLLVDRHTGQLSRRQVRDIRQALGVPVGFRQAGELGEWPLHFEAEEFPGIHYRIERRGKEAVTRSLSEFFVVPVPDDAAETAPEAG